MSLSDTSPENLAAAQQAVTGTFYWEKKDLAAYLGMSQALLDLALLKAEQADDAELAVHYRDCAIRNLYNISSMTWPGWDEEGIEISEADLETGLKAARLNVEMAAADDLPPQRRQMGLWMLGVQLLASGLHEEAEQILNQQKALLKANELPGSAVTEGYLVLIKDLANGSSEVDQAVAALKASEDKDTAQQGEFLETAARIFKSWR